MFDVVRVLKLDVINKDIDIGIVTGTYKGEDVDKDEDVGVDSDVDSDVSPEHQESSLPAEQGVQA